MKKLLLLSLLLLNFTISNTSFAENNNKFNPIDIEVLSLVTHHDSLIIDTNIANVGTKTITGFNDLRLDVYNKDNDKLIDQGEYSGEAPISKLVIKPGQTVKATFIINEDGNYDLGNSYFKWLVNYTSGSDDLYTNGTHIFLNGNEMKLPTAPQHVNQTILVPLRSIFEQLGATVSWDQSDNLIKIIKDDTVITHELGSKVLTINDRKITLDIASTKINGITMIPIQAVPYSLSCSVQTGRIGEATTIAITK